MSIKKKMRNLKSLRDLLSEPRLYGLKSGIIHMDVKKTLVLLLVSVITCLCAKGQAGFLPGYIIKNNSDTLNGLVFFGTDGKFRNKCRFKRFEILREVIYDPSDLKAFGFRNGRYYESKSYGSKNLFFECRIKSEISLYSGHGQPNHQLYIEHAATGFIKLNRGTNRLKNGAVFRNFRELLTWLLRQSGCYGVTADSVDYNAASISRLIRQSLSPQEQSVQVFYHAPGVNWFKDYSLLPGRSSWSFGLTGGYQFVQVNVSGNSLTRYFSEASYDDSYRPAIGFFVDYNLSKKTDLFSVDLSCLYITQRYYGYAAYTTLSECRDELFFEYSALQIPLSLKMTLGKNRIRPFIKAGVYGSFLLSSDYVRYAERQFGSEIYTDWFSDFHLKNDYGFRGGIGIGIPFGHARTLILEAAYIRGNQLLIYAEDIYSVPMDNKIKSNALGFMLSINL
jgi:hypothetical protein